jgi:hypothetical protein
LLAVLLLAAGLRSGARQRRHDGGLVPREHGLA